MDFMRISHRVSAIAIALITGIIISCSLNPTEEDRGSIIVNFPDPNFETLIREILDIPTRDITIQDMWTIEHLSGIGRHITDITGIEYCSGLHILKLQENYIIDIGPLVELVLLDHIDLQNNQISDIKPLVDNTGIGLGNDEIHLTNNPLSDISILQYKPLIQARGVKVYSNAIPSLPGYLNIVDPNFEIVIREHINKSTGDIVSTDLETITNLNADNRNIQNIYGIEYCLNLDTLNISENSISDLYPLSNLNQLTILNLNKNNISDIEPLSSLGYLQYLNLSSNNLNHVNALTNLTQLTTLSLNNNNIQDISPFSGLLNLEHLHISDNPIVSFESLIELGNLMGIALNDLTQFDFSDINGMSSLQTIYLNNTPVINLNLIANITTLQNVFMRNCGIDNIDSLVNLTNLRKLYLKNNNISNITALEQLHELSEVELWDNNITNILALVNNLGISGGNDYVFLINNPLSETSINTYIPQLENRGVHVYF